MSIPSSIPFINRSTSLEDCDFLRTEGQPTRFTIYAPTPRLTFYTWRFDDSSSDDRGKIFGTATFSLSALLFLLLAKPSSSIHHHHHDHFRR